jgi:hypothetical protein
MLTGGIIAAVVAAMTVPAPGHAVGDHTRAGYRCCPSTPCRPDRRVNITRPVEKAYRDPIGDMMAGHSDIVGIWISDLRGVVTVKIDVKGTKDGLLIFFDTNCDGYENYPLYQDLGLGSGRVELWRENKDSEIFAMRAASRS